jgi:hypothetical protein
MIEKKKEKSKIQLREKKMVIVIVVVVVVIVVEVNRFRSFTSAITGRNLISSFFSFQCGWKRVW